MPTVSVLLVNYNGRHLLAAVLAALAAQTRPADEVILVDNASSDGGADFVREHFPAVRLLALETNTGFAEGNNRAAAAAEGDYLALLNTDAIPDPGWLAELTAALEAAPLAAAAVAKVYLGAPPLLESAGAEFDNLGFSWGRGIRDEDAGQFEVVTEVAGLTGCAMMVRRQALGGEPLFDPRLFMYYEDFELALRLRGAGHSLLYVPGAVVCHQRAGSVLRAWKRPRARQLHYSNRNRVKILAKHFPASVLIRSLPLIVLSLIYFDWLILREEGVRSLVGAVAAQFRYAADGLRERRQLPPGAEQCWLPWMHWHGLRGILALRAQLGLYIQT